MSPDPRLPELFEEASELPAAARAAWLGELRAREPELAREVEELLAAAELADPRLDALPLDLLREAPHPDRVGPYRILRQIGHGGMARVFLAEQETEGFRRQVALKVVDRPLMAENAVRRFRDEVRILAGLAHPGIARFLDGGRAPDGTWYLALEYVEGLDLLDHAERLGLGPDDRVRLFLAVLDAVAYAHGRGVVHRDLKPANVLVGSDGRPRLLDFGISKVIDGELDEAAPATRTDHRAFTPAYASPEQFRGDPVTPAVDVYALGVLLYELLAGVHPYRSATGSREALERAVLDSDPEPPSTAARRSASGTGSSGRTAGATGEPPAAGWRRGAPPRAGLGGDLDAICLKALRKEPADRYATAAAMAADLQRYLDRLPVLARRGGRRYRAAKFLRRNGGRLAIAASAVVAIAALGFAAAVHRHAALPALAPAAPAPAAAARPAVPPALPTDRSAAELEAAFAARPESLATGAALAIVLAREGRSSEALAVIGRMRQVAGATADPLADFAEANLALGLDEPQRALALASRSLAAAERGSPPGIVARIRATRARALSVLGRREEARRELALSVAEAERSGDQATLARNLNDLAIEEAESGDLVAAERLWEAAAAASRADSGKPWATILGNLAAVARQRGRPDLAEPRLREVVASFREMGRPRRIGGALGELSECLRDLGRPREAAALRDEALGILREAGNETALALVLFYDGDAAVARGELVAVDASAAAIEAAAQASGDRTGLGLAELLRGRAAALAGEVPAARRHLGEARRLFASSGSGDGAAAATLDLAALELRAGGHAAAGELAQEVAAAFASPPGNSPSFRAGALLARLDAAAGRTAAAAERLRALADGATRPAVAERVAFLGARAEVARSQGKRPAARGDLAAAIAAARAAELRAAELDLQLDLARLELEGGDVAGGEALAAEVAAAAEPLGLGSVAARARAVAALAPSLERLR